MSNLRECYNQLTIVGTLKTKEVKLGTSPNGESTITLALTIASKTNDNKVHEHNIRFWAKNTSKLYNSYSTVATDYKSSDEHGDAADKIKISGSLEMNEYYSSAANEVKTYNNLRGVFVNRIEKNDESLHDEVGAVVEGVITNTIDEIGKDGSLTGRKKVTFMTVGYGSSIHEFQNVFIEKELAQQFTQLYPINSTGKLYFKVNNYAEIEEQQQQPVLGFGTALSNMPDSTVKKYVSDVIIVGGDSPNPLNRFTAEQVEEIKKHRELAKNEKMNTAPATPPQPTGFGTGFQAMPDQNISNNIPF